MKKFLALLLLLLFIILAWFGWKWYKETVLCCNNSVEETVTTPKAVKYGPLVFNWNSDKAIINDLWPNKKNEIVSGLVEGKILRIVGPYFSDEVNNTTFENLGFARANAVRQLLIDSISNDIIEIDSKLVDFLEDAKTKPFGGTTLNWMTRNENIQQIDDKSLIYFPYNSTKKLDNININDYLASIVKELKGNNKTITLTGHTDNIGNPSFNKDLGMQRALAIKQILISLDIDGTRIIVASEGQAQPIASNDTEEGRQKNRRVELEIK